MFLTDISQKENFFATIHVLPNTTVTSCNWKTFLNTYISSIYFLPTGYFVACNFCFETEEKYMYYLISILS